MFPAPATAHAPARQQGTLAKSILSRHKIGRQQSTDLAFSYLRKLNTTEDECFVCHNKRVESFAPVILYIVQCQKPKFWLFDVDFPRVLRSSAAVRLERGLWERDWIVGSHKIQNGAQISPFLAHGKA